MAAWKEVAKEHILQINLLYIKDFVSWRDRVKIYLWQYTRGKRSFCA